MSDADNGKVLMLGYMNGEALERTIATDEAYYWRRSRQCLEYKDVTRGHMQKVVGIGIDDDQGAVRRFRCQLSCQIPFLLLSIG